MTPEEKARRYDEALEIARKNYISAKGLYKDSKIGILNVFKNIIEKTFPELKESEDEKIKKAIIKSLPKRGYLPQTSITVKNAIAWLEKQGEKDKLVKELGQYKVKYIQETLEKYVNSMSNKDDERLRKTTIAFLKDFAEQGYENAVECIDWLEKQEKEEKKY